jgi:hypothetical protein
MFSEKESLASTGLYMVDRLVQQHVVYLIMYATTTVALR